MNAVSAPQSTKTVCLDVSLAVATTMWNFADWMSVDNPRKRDIRSLMATKFGQELKRAHIPFDEDGRAVYRNNLKRQRMRIWLSLPEAQEVLRVMTAAASIAQDQLRLGEFHKIQGSIERLRALIKREQASQR